LRPIILKLFCELDEDKYLKGFNYRNVLKIVQDVLMNVSLKTSLKNFVSHYDMISYDSLKFKKNKQ